MTLSRQQSQTIVRTVAQVMDELDRSWLDLKGKCSDADFAEYGSKVAAALDNLSCDVLVPIFQQHPELEPLTDEDLMQPEQER
ncbi:hypothetical protein [Paradevosia shaoguanensis]|uniref:Uncharacterized protein n=1 Tax=Paradevosia shaoguanensis TaxID=1335043 RepID=A0AA41QLX2_9HYPH|nr:hypothetical protein [Paradevosia shaoguanensis]MCF1742105.1 hypothetical protein [Paradevosia shaoguanensis]MCI0126588.1 hypothetical protein [Paradevosia shaoguanensis]